MKITIREAEVKDCPRMMELIKELAIFEKEPDAVTVNFDHFVECGFGNNPVWKAVVAEMDDPAFNNGEKWIPGFAIFYARYSTWKGKRLYLEDLIVTEKMRGKGLGKLLFEWLIDKAKQQGYTGMTWQVLDWNIPAIEFYKKYNATLESGWLNGNIQF